MPLQRRRSVPVSDEARQVLNQITPNRARLLSALVTTRTLAEAAQRAGIPFESARSEMKRLREITGSEAAHQVVGWWVVNAPLWASLMADYAEAAPS